MEKEYPECVIEVSETNEPCSKEACRYWIEYEKDLNCTHVCVQKNGPMKLHEIGERLQLTIARINQIEKATLKKISKNKSLRVLVE